MYLEAEVWTVARTDKGNAVLIHPLKGELAVPIFIGSLEAQNILLGMGDVEIPRPLSHDLMLNLLTTLGAEVVQVEIHTIKEGTFYANLVITNGQRQSLVDARPSDALALAVRCRCPIFVEEAIVEEVGIPLASVKTSPEDLPEEEPSAEITTGPSDKERLEAALQRAVSEENYEEAARLRDQLKNWS